MSTFTKVAIITGASAGIGRYTAVALSEAGWNVVITARRGEVLEETKRQMKESKNCLALAGDITQEAFVKSLFEETINVFGRLDLLFNNAGMSQPQVPIENLSREIFQNVIDVNLIAPFLCTQQAMRIFKSQSPPGGRIINNGSISAKTPRPLAYAYTSSKHGLTGLTKTTALEGRPFNIACTQINIGNTGTDMASHHSQGALQADGRMIPEQVMDVAHVVNSVVYVASLPNDVSVLEMTVIPTQIPFVGRG
ncbi:NAD(P)-binding protein [Marasmius fiardii PR-910]|nr:NAD(P)-binding protein [Marasmius fiardii PR-910]